MPVRVSEIRENNISFHVLSFLLVPPKRFKEMRHSACTVEIGLLKDREGE